MPYRDQDLAAAELLRGKLLRRELAREQLQLAGHVGDRPARLASGGESPAPTDDFETFMRSLQPWGRVALVRAAVAAARAALPLWDARYPDFPEPGRVIDLTETWLSCMCQGCADAANDATFEHGDYDDMNRRQVTLPEIGAVESWAESAHWSCDTCGFLIQTVHPFEVARNVAFYSRQAVLTHPDRRSGDNWNGEEADIPAATGLIFRTMRHALRTWAQSAHPFGFQQAVERSKL